MRHALGGGRAGWSRKTDLITHILIRQSRGGMSVAQCKASVVGYRRKTVAELEALAKEALTNTQNPAPVAQ